MQAIEVLFNQNSEYINESALPVNFETVNSFHKNLGDILIKSIILKTSGYNFTVCRILQSHNLRIAL